jgi:hypothetical protein
MGDTSPPAANKQAAQKQSQNDAATQKRKDADAAKQVVKK